MWTWIRMNGVQSWRSIQYCRRSLSFSHPLSHLAFHTDHIMWISCISGVFGENSQKTRNWCFCRRIETTSGYTSWYCIFIFFEVNGEYASAFYFSRRKLFFQTISLYWTVLWLSIIFWVQANSILISGLGN